MNAFTATKTEKTFKIATFDLHEVKNAFAKMAKSLAKKCSQVATLTEGQTAMVSTGKNYLCGTPILEERTEITISYPLLVVEGWSFVAKVEKIPYSEEILTSLAPAFEGEELGNRSWDLCLCDHCSTRRDRNRVYLLRHENGKEQQVGSSCIQSFLGIDPGKVLTYFDVLNRIETSFGGDEDNDPSMREGRQRGWSLFSFADASACAVEKAGWVSTSKAREGEGQATKDMVAWYLGTEKGKESHAKSTKPEHGKTAVEAIKWAQNMPKNGSDFERNLGAIARSGFVPFGKEGLASAIVGCYITNKAREAEREEREKASVESSWWGTVKKRESINVKVVSLRFFADDWNGKTLVNMIGEGGEILIWWARGDHPKEGEEFLLTATVKDHGEYKGTKQTTVQRGKGWE